MRAEVGGEWRAGHEIHRMPALQSQREIRGRRHRQESVRLPVLRGQAPISEKDKLSSEERVSYEAPESEPEVVQPDVEETCENAPSDEVGSAVYAQD